MSNYLKNVRTAPLKAIAARVIEYLPKDSMSVDKLEEWAYQAYESIAPREIYEVGIDYKEVFNNKAPLPDGLYRLEMVLYREFDSDMGNRPRTNPFSNQNVEFETSKDLSTGKTTDTITKTTVTTEITRTNVKINSGSDIGVIKGKLDKNLTEDQLYYPSDFSSSTDWKPLRLASNVFHNSVLLGAPSQVYRNCEPAFSIQNGCVVTTFERGQLCMAYTGIPTNDEGEFLYADYEYVSDALEAAVLKKYWKWKYNTGNVSGAQQKYQQFSHEFELLGPKASAALMMPDLIQSQNIRNMNKFIKEDSPFATAMGALNNTETMHFNNPTRYNSFQNYNYPRPHTGSRY